MDRVVGEITERLIQLLPEDKSYYTPQDLLVSEIPSFLVERVVLELKRNLADSIVPPETDWADMNSESVQKAWSAFLEAIRAETRLPAGYVKPVMESAVGDLLELLVEPRKQIPEYLFANKTELTYEEVNEQSRWIVVYPHFKRALPRYMEKKKLDRMDRNRCENLIRHVDEKLTTGYSALNWAQLIEPWYQLMGQEVDSELLRRFFEDKDMASLAKRFDQEEGKISRSRVIEIVSSPDIEEDQPLEQESSQPKTPVMHDQPEQKHSEQPSSVNQKEADREANSLIEQLGSLKADNDEQEDSSNYAYNFADAADQQEEEAETEDQQSESRENPFGLYNRESGQTSEPESATEPEPQGEKEETETRETESADEEDEPVPMWQRFVGGNEDDTGLGLARDDDEEDEDDESNPIIDLQSSSDQPKNNEDYHKLIHEIQDVKEYFVEELFGGDEAAFERCMEHVVTFSTWSEAAKFITQEVFRRNMVDMYSDVAVEFTDRMQTFFLQKS